MHLVLRCPGRENAEIAFYAQSEMHCVDLYSMDVLSKICLRLGLLGKVNLFQIELLTVHIPIIQNFPTQSTTGLSNSVRMSGGSKAFSEFISCPKSNTLC